MTIEQMTEPTEEKIIWATEPIWDEDCDEDWDEDCDLDCDVSFEEWLAENGNEDNLSNCELMDEYMDFCKGI